MSDFEKIKYTYKYTRVGFLYLYLGSKLRRHYVFLDFFRGVVAFFEIFRTSNNHDGGPMFTLSSLIMGRICVL